MRTVFDNRGEGVRKSSRGKQFIEDHYSGQRAAKTIMDRLGEFAATFKKMVWGKTASFLRCTILIPQSQIRPGEADDCRSYVPHDTQPGCEMVAR
jgi:hypothetical protein